MNFSSFFLQIILCCVVYINCHPSASHSPPEEYDNGVTNHDGVANDDGVDYTDPPHIVKAYQSKEFTKFDLLLLRALSKKHLKNNIVISPSSIKSLLALMINVYSKNKFDLIAGNSGDEDRSISLIRELHTLLQNNNTEITIESRNKIYQASDVKLTTTNENAAEVETLDFASPSAADVINKWVSDITRGLITSAVDKNQISGNTKLVLLNCVYLKAKWDSTFDQALTNDACFYSSPGKCHQVKFMYANRQLKFADIRDHKSIMFELPFVDQRYVITFMLPRENSNVNDLLTSLKDADLFELFDRMEETKAKLKLPRTSIEFKDSDLVQTLKQKSMKSFFGQNVKLDTMLRDDTLSAVDTLFHRARIVLDEDGGEAAAVSGGIEFRSGWPADDLVIAVERPYLFFLRDINTGFILFEGLVYSPDGKN